MKFEILFIISIVILQIIVFIVVNRKITSLKVFFPNDLFNLSIKKVFISQDQLESPEHFYKYINDLDDTNYNLFQDSEEGETFELIVRTRKQRLTNKEFNNVINSINSYLSRNKGATSDFNIIKDICERNVEKLDNGIGNLINVPLYLGLAGTFTGIIFGLFSLQFQGDPPTLTLLSMKGLINGVMLAMTASLFGLLFTLLNSAIFYKPSTYKNECDKDLFYDIIQKDLLPALNTGMASSMNSFKNILEYFIKQFGEGLKDYKDGASLLNQNLKHQKEVLQEINKLKITQVSVRIAEIFKTLKDSSEDLQTFKDYQKKLNKNISSSTTVVSGISELLDKFREFNNNLNSVVENISSSQELQSQFKQSLEQHFPTIEDHRVVWRNSVDEFNNDVKAVYESLLNHFKETTNFIKEYTKRNTTFLDAQIDIHKSIDIYVENSKLIKEQNEGLFNEIVEMRKDMNNAFNAILDLNKDLIELHKQKAIKTIKKES